MTEERLIVDIVIFLTGILFGMAIGLLYSLSLPRKKVKQ